MQHLTTPRAVFVFNRNGFEGFYVLSEDRSDRLKMMHAVSTLQADIDMLSKKFVKASGFRLAKMGPMGSEDKTNERDING